MTLRQSHLIYKKPFSYFSNKVGKSRQKQLTKAKKNSILNKHFNDVVLIRHFFALLAQLDRATSYPLRKALIMLFRGEISEHR